ncbi:alcohol dehydrogenase catalytic domain-containing protein [Pseudoclavibacter endophyticus]|uniref:Alcohol dehydrogenase catalytic domain-containing protein n=2 Tax=Pseudoclavibacter endophyticus TaxID=1778590 RepID=A0A6H9WUE0_9MICO|nr:alcohol dehydrogenase catalytic domain-containing protein [Pseudoclavibacter endophyticus]
MTAAVLRETGVPFSIEAVEMFDPAPGRVIVRTHASPFCVTDVHNWSGALAKIPPTILGHASIGEVVEVGPSVTRVRVGQRAVVPGTPECGTCYYCAIGEPWQCGELFDLNGVYPDIAKGEDGAPISCAGNVGGYAELMNVSQNQTFPIESDLPSEVLSMLGCGITTGVGAVVNVAQLQAGESVAIFGAGQLGLWMLQGARLRDAAFVAVVEPDATRRVAAERLGADVVIDPAAEDHTEVLRRLTDGRGVDVALEATNSVSGQRDALLSSRRGGRIVVTGFERGDSEVTLPQTFLTLQSRQVRSAQNGNVRMFRDLERFTRLLERGKLTPEGIMTRTYAVDEIDAARDAAASHDDICGIIAFPH